MVRGCGLNFAGVAMLVTFASPVFGASTAFRIDDLDLRDPHLYFTLLGCRDVTDISLNGFAFNSDLQTRLQTDGDSDGYLDLSLLIVFDPLDQSATGGRIRFGASSCATPLGSTTCGPIPSEQLVGLLAVNGSSGSCLATLPNTVRPYNPSVTGSNAPCFASDAMDLLLDLKTVVLPLKSARIAAVYSGSPGTELVSGLIRGFLTQTDADNTVISASTPLIGGMLLASLLPGGDPPGPNNTSCASFSDKDVGPDGVTQGWWMYFNFRASLVPYAGPHVGVYEDAERPRAISALPNPFRSHVTLDCWLAREGPARIGVFDLSGREVAELASGRLAAGPHRLIWDGRRTGELPTSPGLYMVRVSSNGRSISKRIVLLR